MIGVLDLSPAGTGDIEQFTPYNFNFLLFSWKLDFQRSEVCSQFRRFAISIGVRSAPEKKCSAISTFPKSLEHSNFHAVAISTFSDLQGVCNFCGLQFPHARGARKRKNTHLVCLYKAETTSSPPQARKNRLRVPLARGKCLEIVRRKVFFLAISTRARSAPAENLTTILAC